MTKVLIPYTIIPPDLYIQRDADRQVKNIIHDMGRPGYVLVSRQMGKTNLLLNAKRNLEKADDVFVYIDLSNPSENAKMCFENIIDIALETNANKLEKASKIIYERRRELIDTPPYKQHTSELRIILSSIKGKLVIILDEIDALTKTPYSDQIFAQIRSIYFSRVNFKELHRLTYLLSGVIEPTEIIRDPKISPFNIGQKIFLNDFNRDEFEIFLTNSRLNLTNDIKDRIFYWTNGNPRITWEVCSEVENHLKKEKLTTSIIDKIVHQTYLTSFDKPPIDNIREIIKNDREIRNSIVEIEYNKGKDVSDKIKSKLYLAGIINYDENDIHIKNEIIKRSLNIDWIKSLEEEEKGLIGLGIEHYQSGRYIEALKYFEKYLKNEDFPDNKRDHCYFYMGSSFFLQGNFIKALDCFNKSNYDIEYSPKTFFSKEILKGLSYKGLRDYENSKKCFELIINNSIKDENYLEATVNLGSLYMINYEVDKIQKAIELFENIVFDNLSISSKVSESLLNNVKLVAFYNLADIYRNQKNYSEVINLVSLALPLSTFQTKPSLLFLQALVTENIEDKLIILKKIIEEIIVNNIEPIDFSFAKPLNYNVLQLKDILLEIYLSNILTFNEIIDEHAKLIKNKTKGELLFEIAIHSINKNNIQAGISILNLIHQKTLDGYLELDSLLMYNTLKLISFFTNPHEALNIKLDYIEMLKNNQTLQIDRYDITIFANLIIALMELNNFNDALKFIHLIYSFKKSVPDELIVEYIAFYNFELHIYLKLKSKEKVLQLANEILKLINDEKIIKFDSTIVNKESFKLIKVNAERIVNSANIVKKPVKYIESYSRNEKVKVRFKDGTIIETKFKKIEKELNSGECFLLN